MEEQFVPYQLDLKLKELGFDEPCFAHYINDDFIIMPGLKSSSMIYYRQNNINPNNQYGDNCCIAPLWQQAFDWFEDKFNLTSIIYKQYPYENSPFIYWTYGISDINNESIINPNDMFGDLLEECHQDIPGNYLNNEKFNKLIFERGYAFAKKNDAKIACLEKLIEIAQNQK